MFHPSRGGTRGGKDQFNWDEVKGSKDREFYIGHSVHALTGRWQNNRDVYWFSRDKVEQGSAIQDELALVKAREQQMMEEALGLRPTNASKNAQGPPNLHSHEIKALLARAGGGERAAEDAGPSSHLDLGHKGLGAGQMAVALGGSADREVMQGTVHPGPGPGPGLEAPSRRPGPPRPGASAYFETEGKRDRARSPESDSSDADSSDSDKDKKRRKKDKKREKKEKKRSKKESKKHRGRERGDERERRRSRSRSREGQREREREGAERRDDRLPGDGRDRRERERRRPHSRSPGPHPRGERDRGGAGRR